MTTTLFFINLAKAAPIRDGLYNTIHWNMVGRMMHSVDHLPKETIDNGANNFYGNNR